MTRHQSPAAPYYSRILRQVEELASEHGYETILAGFQDRGAVDPQRAARADRLWGGWPVDGVLAMDVRWLAEACRQSCAHRHVPLVGLGSDYSEDHDFVAFDVETGVRQAVTHLVEIGCRRIAHLSGGVSIEHVRLGRAGVPRRKRVPEPVGPPRHRPGAVRSWWWRTCPMRCRWRA